MRIVRCRQYDDVWFDSRLGLVTASEADALISPKWEIRKGAGVHTYVCKKVAESFLCAPVDSFSSFETEQGSLLEMEAIPYYELTHNVDIERVGLIVSDDNRSGCSPDGIIKGEQRGVECKCPQPTNAVRYNLDGIVPPDYELQVHFSMFVTGFQSWVFYSYHRTLPKFTITVERDEKKMGVIREALEMFYSKFDAAFEQLNKTADEPRPNPFKK